jgi:hypothetical protein
MTRTFALLLAAALGSRGMAQSKAATVDVGAVGLRYADTVSSGGITVSPAFRFVTGRTSFDAIATLSKFNTGLSGQGAVALSSFTPARSGFTAEGTGSAGGSGHEDGSKTGEMSTTGRLHYMKSSAGAWVGTGLGGIWDGLAWRRVREVEAGAWLTSGNTQVVLSTTPTVVDDTIRYADTQGALAWQTPRAAVVLTLGTRAGSRLPSVPGDSRLWGGVSVIAPVSVRASVLAGAGTYPLDFTQGFPAGRYVTAGLRFGVGAATRVRPLVVPSAGITRFDVRRVSEASIAIEVTAQSARTVEIMGDLTMWEPEAMRPLGNGRFVIVLPVTSETSQINIRVNGGGWTVPPGLTVVKDELGALVGILVIPDR